MTTPGAIALTGLVVGVLALALALQADSRRLNGSAREAFRRCAWVTFVVALLLFVAAIWMEAS